MTPRARRLLAPALALALLLVVGRGVVDLLATRWWAAAIAPEALQSVTRWQLLGVLLDVGAVLTASAWFAAQALLVARAIASVQIQRDVGGLPVREALPTRWLVAGAVATGVVLGFLTGAGAHDWRAPMALAWQGVHYGLAEPILGADLGTFVAAVPLWELAHGFVLLLLGLGIGFATVLYAAIGALGVRERRFRMHPDARRHLGGLLVLLAVVIGWGYLLSPYRLVMQRLPLVAETAIQTRVLAAQAMAGAAFAVAILTAIWALRGRQTLVVAAWSVLALGAFGERVIVPAFVAEGPPADRAAELPRRFDAALYALEAMPASPRAVASGTLPEGGVWDEDALGRWALGRGALLLSASVVPHQQVGVAWQVVTSRIAPSPRVEVHHLALDSIAAGGVPVDIAPVSVVHDPLAVPGGTRWRRSDVGVVPGGILRRVALAWAQQAPGILGVRSGRVDWLLDPVSRLQQLVPAIGWHLDGIVQMPTGPVWLLSGVQRVARAPLAVPTDAAGDPVSGLRPAMIASVGLGDGRVHVWLDPEADSLAVAWSRVHAPLVRPASELPEQVAAVLRYPRTWFQAQVEALAARDPSLGRLPPPRGRAVAGAWDGVPAWSATLLDPDDGEPLTRVVGRRVGVHPELRVQRASGRSGVGADELTRAWFRMPGLAQLRDSIRAAGDTLLAGPLRWELRERGLVAWQSFASAGRRGSPALVWVGTADEGVLGGGRTPALAWDSAGRSAADAAGLGLEEMARLEALRAWMRRADSALQRRDMTAFGRAWEALHGLLLEPDPE